MRCLLLALLVPGASAWAQDERTRAVESAKRVLSGEEFEEIDGPTFLEEAMEWIGNWLDRLFGNVESPFSGLGSILGPILLAVAIAIVLLLVVWIVAQFAGARREKFLGGGVVSERHQPPHELLRLSEEAEALGDFSRAFTLAYWAFLKLADAAGVVDYSDDATNWEILATGRYGDEIAGEARKGARLFDEIEYGDSAAENSDVQSVRALIAKLEVLEVAA